VGGPQGRSVHPHPPILFVLILSFVVFGEVLLCLKFISHTHTHTHTHTHIHVYVCIYIYIYIYNVFLHCYMFVALQDPIESMAPANSVL